MLIACLLCLAITFSASASNTEVYADSVGTSGGTVTVPLLIRNNPGLMGCKLIVKFDSGILQPQTVTRGTVTQSGMMNDSIGTSQDGTLLIVWSDTDAVKADGTLAVLTFKANEQSDTTLTMSYSQPDTFDGEFNDVSLDCKPVEIRFGSEETGTMPVTKQPDRRDIIAAVDSVEDKTDVSAVNDAIARLTGTEDLYSTPEEVQSAYSTAVAENFVETALLAVDGEKIDTAIQSALQEVSAETVDSVPPEKQAAFAQSVETALQTEAPDVPTISDKLPAEETVRAIKLLQSKNIQASTSGVSLSDVPRHNKRTALWFGFGIGSTTIFIVIIFIIIKKCKQEKETIK